MLNPKLVTEFVKTTTRVKSEIRSSFEKKTPSNVVKEKSVDMMEGTVAWNVLTKVFAAIANARPAIQCSVILLTKELATMGESDFTLQEYFDFHFRVVLTLFI